MSTDPTPDPLAPTEQDFWFKPVEMLQTNWAVIRPTDAGAEIVVIHDGSGIFDRIAVPDAADAARQLRRNGFRRFAEDAEAAQFIAPPRPPYREARHPNGPIYSSGRFWCAD